MGDFFIYNRKALISGHPIQETAKRSRLSGDGLFETMRVHHDSILLEDYHFERLFAGMQAMQFELPTIFTRQYIKDLILSTCRINGPWHFARVRLTVFRNGTTDAPDKVTDLIIESWEIDPSYAFPERGLKIGLYTGASKNIDATAAYKINYQLYAVAADHARDHQLDDCLILNSAGNICDTSIANVFCIEQGVTATPPLSEGCIAGVMRRHLLSDMQQKGYPVIEKPLTIEMLLAADEVFLTNVIRGIMPVKKLQQALYNSTLTKKIFSECLIHLGH